MMPDGELTRRAILIGGGAGTAAGLLYGITNVVADEEGDGDSSDIPSSENGADTPQENETVTEEEESQTENKTPEEDDLEDLSKEKLCNRLLDEEAFDDLKNYLNDAEHYWDSKDKSFKVESDTVHWHYKESAPKLEVQAEEYCEKLVYKDDEFDVEIMKVIADDRSDDKIDKYLDDCFKNIYEEVG